MSAPGPYYRDDPPTAAEIAAHAEREDCSVWGAMGNWMVLEAADQTVCVTAVLLGCGGPADTETVAQHRDAVWRPLNIHGDPVPWPEVSR